MLFARNSVRAIDQSLSPWLGVLSSSRGLMKAQCCCDLASETHTAHFLGIQLTLKNHRTSDSKVLSVSWFLNVRRSKDSVVSLNQPHEDTLCDLFLIEQFPSVEPSEFSVITLYTWS